MKEQQDGLLCTNRDGANSLQIEKGAYLREALSRGWHFFEEIRYIHSCHVVFACCFFLLIFLILQFRQLSSSSSVAYPFQGMAAALYAVLFCAYYPSVTIDIPKCSEIQSSHFFHCLPLLLFPGIRPSRIFLPMLSCRFKCPKYCSFLLVIPCIRLLVLVGRLRSSLIERLVLLSRQLTRSVRR